MLNKTTTKTVLSLALPAVGEMLLYTMIWVLDTMMVGRYGGDVAVSTVGLSSEIMNTIVGIFMSVGLSVGITSIVARRIGAKQVDAAEEYASIGFAFGIIMAFVICLLIFIFCDEILSVAGAKNDVIFYGSIFMRITSFGIFFNMLGNMLSAIMRGYGNTKTPLLIAALVNIITLGLDWLLIFGHYGLPELGITGSAIATTIAQFSGFLFAVFFIIKKSKLKLRLKYIKSFRYERLVELLKLSIPSSFQEAAFSLSRLLSTFIIMHIGTVAFAANQITTTIESLSYMPGWGFGVAATTLVGHKIGEKNPKKAREYAYTCTILGTVIMSLFSIIFLIMPRFLISSFLTSGEGQVVDLGAMCLMIASIEQPFMAISMIIGGSLKGAGDTKTPFSVSLISSWVIRLPLMFYFIYELKLPITYVWWITTLQWIFDGSLIFILFKRKFRNQEREM